MLIHLHPHIRIISPASPELASRVEARLPEFEAAGISVSYHKLAPDPSWPFIAGSAHARLAQIMEGLDDPQVTALLASRGGYGASDLLDLFPWERLQQLRPKPIIGFSDVSALHAAFYTRLGWQGLHAPMPGTDYWRQNGDGDVLALLTLLKGGAPNIRLPLLYLGRGLPPQVRGWAFGGCLSVLTNLIGTPYFPQNLDGALVFWEDIGEHPGRILRFANQWLQSGALRDARGIVLGRFAGCEIEGVASESQLHDQLAQRLGLPVWFCPHFGHCSPNWPLPIGGQLRIEGDSLSWDLDEHGLQSGS